MTANAHVKYGLRPSLNIRTWGWQVQDSLLNTLGMHCQANVMFVTRGIFNVSLYEHKVLHPIGRLMPLQLKTLLPWRIGWHIAISGY